MSGTVTSRELVYHQFLKRRDFLTEILPLAFGEFPNPPKRIKVSLEGKLLTNAPIECIMIVR